MPSRGLRIVLIGWAIVLGLLWITAFAKRQADHRQLRAKVIQEMALVAEAGAKTVDEYIWGPQGRAIYLLNHGYASPALERSLLLCEARRCYDWKYLYPRVVNYDLRTRLIAHCLRDFPDDPKVHWAAGQLSLAAGEYEQAERELGKTVALAEKYPNKSPFSNARAFCVYNGISEQHLRGRYASALTLMGKWQEADDQMRLAKGAGDGAKPPPDAPYPYASAEEIGQFKEQQSTAKMNRFFAEMYAKTHDAWLPELWLTIERDSRRFIAHPEEYKKYQEEQSRLLQEFVRNHPDWLISIPLTQTPTENLAQAQDQLLLMYLMAQEWDNAAKIVTAQDWLDRVKNAYETSLRSSSALLLTRLALGQKLGQTAGAHLAAQRAEVAKQHAATGEPIDKWELAGADAGELAGLLDADYLPFLLRTDMFADALRHSGRQLPEVLAEVRAVTQPQRDTYSDYSNGELRWK